MIIISHSAIRAHDQHSIQASVHRALNSAGAMSLAVTLSLVAGELAQAQQRESDAARESELAEVVVTGTRIVRDGYEAPTPLTVMGIDEINAEAPANIADFVNQMPSVAGSTTPQNSQTSISNGSAGINSLNLRNLGTARTLVLLNGQRVAAPTLLASSHGQAFNAHGAADRRSNQSAGSSAVRALSDSP